MKFLRERTEIASAINFHKYPTIPLDVSNVTEYGIKGGRFLVDCGKFRDGEPWYEPSELYIYRDKRKLVVSGSGGCCLHAGFGYHDIIEMMENRNLPIVKADQDILIVAYDSKTKEAFLPFIVHTGKHVDPHCTTPITIEGDDVLDSLTKAFIKRAGFPDEPENKPEPDWEYMNY